jgi:hypothetical protein
VSAAECSRRFRQRHPDRYREQSRRGYEKKRAWLDELKAGPCADCGGDFPPFVKDWHHRDPDSKSFNVSERWGRSKEILLAEIEKCDLLCANCHRIREHDGA